MSSIGLTVLSLSSSIFNFFLIIAVEQHHHELVWQPGLEVGQLLRLGGTGCLAGERPVEQLPGQ